MRVEEPLETLPSYVCMVCGRRKHLAPVARPMERGAVSWWVCRPGHGCAEEEVRPL